MIRGALIVKSLRVPATLEDLDIVVRKVVRTRPENTTPEQPEIWSLLYCEADDSRAESLSAALAERCSSATPSRGPGRAASLRRQHGPSSVPVPRPPDASGRAPLVSVPVFARASAA